MEDAFAIHRLRRTTGTSGSPAATGKSHASSASSPLAAASCSASTVTISGAANGDSRAVVQRSGEAVPVTQDHKPDREDEAARVRAAGGKVVYAAGSYRVNGMLAMSRAIGDHFLRPYVIAEPEITVLHRSSQDEVLIIATDGLWDVFGNSEAATLATRCITRSMDRGMSRHGACRVAASVLTKVALERGSRDNITVIVVDITLQQSSGDAEGGLQRPSGERGSGKAANPNNHSVGTHFRIKSRPSSEAGDGGGRNHGAGHSALDDRPPKRFNSGVSLPQPQPSQAPTLSQAAATAKQARFPTSLDSSTAPQPTTRCWTTVLLGRSPRPASPANPSLKRSSFQSSQSSLTPSLQSSAEERTAAASAPELPSTDPSLSAWSELSCTNRPCHAAAGGTTTTTTTASESMFAAATAASGQGFIAPPKDVELPATDWTFKVQQSSSAAPELSHGLTSAFSFGRSPQVWGSGCLPRGQSLSVTGYATVPDMPQDPKLSCPDLSKDSLTCWGSVSI
ncbi:MAG: hypothetical protein WDW36_002811 [Sanguina aurantia]